MDKKSANFVKLALIIPAAVILIVIGIYSGKKYPISQKKATHGVNAAKNPKSQDNLMSPNVTIDQKTSKNDITITGGGTGIFPAFKMLALSDWTVTKTSDKSPGFEKLLATKGNYQLIIVQGPIGGENCTFPGSNQSNIAIGLLDPVKEITLSDNTSFKRGTVKSTNTDFITYTVCQKEKDGSFSSLTKFGTISYDLPVSPSMDIVSQIDAMVSSLQKK